MMCGHSMLRWFCHPTFGIQCCKEALLQEERKVLLSTLLTACHSGFLDLPQDSDRKVRGTAKPLAC